MKSTTSMGFLSSIEAYMKFVEPKTYLIGHSTVNKEGLQAYLRQTGQMDFLLAFEEAVEDGLTPEEALISFYAKLCYKSLVLGENKNVSRIRDIKSNITNCLNVGHGSVFEHIWFNFVTTDCSRVFTHELVRHRIGTAYSQTSGRYCRINSIDFVNDPLLKSQENHISTELEQLERHYVQLENNTNIDQSRSFTEKKKLTSAFRRMLPSGAANEIGWSCNIRAVRHMIMMRTSRHAEWEIRKVFNQVFDILRARYPLLFEDAITEEVDGLREVTGMRMQSYDVDLTKVPEERLIEEVQRRFPEIGWDTR